MDKSKVNRAIYFHLRKAKEMISELYLSGKVEQSWSDSISREINNVRHHHMIVYCETNMKKE